MRRQDCLGHLPGVQRDFYAEATISARLVRARLAPTGATTNPARGANRASRDLNRRLGIRPKTASWPSPRLRFNPAGFAPPTDTNLACARHEQFRYSIGFRLPVQDKNGLVVVYLFGLHILISQEQNDLVAVCDSY